MTILIIFLILFWFATLLFSIMQEDKDNRKHFLYLFVLLTCIYFVLYLVIGKQII